MAMGTPAVKPPSVVMMMVVVVVHVAGLLAAMLGFRRALEVLMRVAAALRLRGEEHMTEFVKALPAATSGRQRRQILWLYALLLTFNLTAWLAAFAAFRGYPLLMGSCLLAYSLGLRHAVDADHIAAIDNVTRKLMQSGQRPLTAGLMFSLGHSTIVVLATLGIAVTAMALQTRLSGFRETGAMIGTLVSTFFLFAIALLNLVVLRAVLRAFRRVRRGEPYVDEDLDMLLAGIQEQAG